MPHYLFDIENGHGRVGPAGLSCRDDEDAIAKPKALAIQIGSNAPSSDPRRPLALEACMSGAGWSPKLVPYGADQTIYLVVDRLGASSTVYLETEIERSDAETIIADFLTGQFNDPVRVIAFNTLEHWSDDVSEAIATEIQTRCDIEGISVPAHVSDFVERYATRSTVARFA